MLEIHNLLICGIPEGGARFSRGAVEHMSQKTEIAAWITTSIKAKGLNQSRVAVAIGVSKATMSRWCNPNDPTMPLWENVSSLSAVLGSSPPGWSAPAGSYLGFDEHGVAALADDGPPEAWNGNITQWRVKDSSMQTKGYMIGDDVKADARIAPVDGDVVVANLYNMQGKARTALRVFKSPHYLIPATADASSLEVHEVGKTAAIFGVVFTSTRRRSEN
jgi:transcriptional regulator with XRE-family HTH domain